MKFVATFAATVASVSAIDCMSSVTFDSVTLNFQKFAGNYQGPNGEILAQNPADNSWMLVQNGLSPIISFDGAECPELNKNWHQLDLEVMQYTKLDGMTMK